MNRTFAGKPVLVVYFDKGALYDFPFNRKEYLQSYKDFFRHAQRYFSIFIVRGEDHYKGNGIFISGYRHTGGTFIRVAHPFAATVLYDKDSEGSLTVRPGKGWAAVNHPSFAQLLFFKDFTYRVLSQYMKPVFRVKNRSECMRALKRVTTQRAVFKPRAGYGGNGIVIAEKDKLIGKLATYDGLIGEFINGEQGIPGLVDSHHDLRLTLADGEIIEAMIRIPKKRSLLANISQGATVKQISPARVPADAFSIALAIDRKFEKFGHRLYSIDFLYEQKKPYVIELNSKPGLPFKSWGAVYGRWHQGLLKVLRAAARGAQREKN